MCNCEVCYFGRSATKLFGDKAAEWYECEGFDYEGHVVCDGGLINKLKFRLHHTHLGLLLSYIRFKLYWRNLK